MSRRLLAGVLIYAACAAPGGAPRFRSISPSQGSDDAVTPVTIRGDGFRPATFTDFDDPSGSRLDDAWVVRVGGARLDDVRRSDETTLTGAVPAGLAPGVYDVVVVDPRGRELVEPGAFRVVHPGAAGGGAGGGTAGGGTAGGGTAGGGTAGGGTAGGGTAGGGTAGGGTAGGGTAGGGTAGGGTAGGGTAGGGTAGGGTAGGGGFILFQDDFESGGIGLWTLSGPGNAWGASNMTPNAGIWHARVQPSDTTDPASIIERAIPTTGHATISVDYARRLIGLDPADQFRSSWFDGTTWRVIELKGAGSVDDAAYVPRHFTLPIGADDNAALRLRFDCTAGAVSESCNVDDVVVSAAQ